MIVAYARSRVVGSPHAPTALTGTTIWPSQARVTLTGDITVPAGARLDIGAGAVIEAARGVTIVFERGGRVNVLGTLNEPVVLTCQNQASTPAVGAGSPSSATH